MAAKGFWILNENGLTLLSIKYKPDIEIDPDIFSALVAAIHSFSKSAGLTPIKQTETEELLILYRYRSNLLFVLIVDKKTKSDKLERYFSSYLDMFFKLYEETVWKFFLQKPIPNTTFSIFEQKIVDLIKKQPIRIDKRNSLQNAFSQLIKKH